MVEELLRDDEGDIRLMGSRTFITEAIARIGAALSVSYDGNLRANRHGSGHRAHAHLRLTAPPALAGAAEAELSPKAAAEAAKARRDIRGEIDTLTAADRELREQPWYPIQPGDVVCWSIDMSDGTRHGETLVAVDDPDWPTQTGAPLRKVSETPDPSLDDADNEQEAADPSDDPRLSYEDFYDIWFEAGPARVAVIRYGQLVHGRLHAT